MGVSVRVTLDDSGRAADVLLVGAPLLGRVAGSAHFNQNDELVMDDALASGLRRRGCTVVDVNEDEMQNHLAVRVKLPIIGDFKLSVQRLACTTTC